MNFAVLGAGVTGLACATTLQDAGEAVTVYESESQPGGLARTEVVNGFVFDCSGGHIFNTRWPDVKEWFFRYLPESEWQYNIRYCKVWYRKDLIIDYPFELGLYKLPLDEAIDCLIDLFKQQTKQEPEPDNLRDWFIWRFGKAIAERYFIPYNRKLWNLNPVLISPVWVQGKMPLPSIREILKAILRKDSSENNTSHSSFYYPKEGGIQNWVNRVAATVPNLRLSTKVESVEKVPAGWIVNGENIYK
ncbi:MAG: NAD(P)-binding protein, partial [Thermodesulfobacteriota bacterium]